MKVDNRCCMAVVSSCREVFGSLQQRAQPLPTEREEVTRWEFFQTMGENGDEVKSVRPLCFGLQMCHNGERQTEAML